MRKKEWMCKQYFLLRDTEIEGERERTIKSNRWNRICQIYAQIRGSNNSSTLSQSVKFACGSFYDASGL